MLNHYSLYMPKWLNLQTTLNQNQGTHYGLKEQKDWGKEKEDLNNQKAFVNKIQC